jgi:hypothetical protein
MAINREAIYAALYARLQAKVTLCKTFSRKWIEPQQIGQDQQPALLCLEGKQTPNDRSPLPPIWTLEAMIVVYARTNDTATPGTILSNILDQIESALEIQPAEGAVFFRSIHTTLGLSTVQKVWIASEVEPEDGAMSGGQGWFTVPVHILAVT